MGGSQQQSPVLLARIAEKKAELANLKDLEALSGGLADQMQMLADKLATLSDGTEGMSEAAHVESWTNGSSNRHRRSTILMLWSVSDGSGIVKLA
jgi:DASH complex subunit DAD2